MPTSFTAKPRVEIAGAPLAPEVDAQIEQIVVDDSRLLPDMFRLQFRDPERTLLSTAGLTIGAKVKIFAGRAGEDAATLLISGEVTALEAEIDETGTHVIARGYDSSHRLQRGRKTRTFVDVDEGAIVSRVVQEAGMSVGSLQFPVSTNHKLVSQMNQSDLEFLHGRARELGYDLVFDDDKVEAHLPVQSATAPATGTLQTTDPLALVMGGNLDSFLPRITAAEQVEKVQVRGWSVDDQQAVVATADAKTASVTLSDGGPTPATTATAFGSGSQFAVVDRPLRTQDEAQAVADAVAEQLASAYAEAEGVASGDPRLCAGAAVSVAGVGSPFEGKYTITSSRHVIGASGYRTHFTVSGRQERSLLGLAGGGDTAGDPGSPGAPVYGVVIALVTNVDDVDGHGRVKLMFPWLDDTYESDWARVAGPGAGKDRGVVFLPEVGDEVLVAFEQGDVRSPFVIGGLWSQSKDMPQKGSLLGNGAVNERVVQGRNGHRLVISDDGGDEGVTLTSGDGQHVISIKNSGSIEITTAGTLKLKGQTITIEGTSISISADASLELKGATVSLSGDGPTTIKGTPLALN